MRAGKLNYAVTEQELLGFVFGVRTFKCYLYDRKFIVITDHRPLKWLLILKDSSLSLAEHDLEVIHRPERRHGNTGSLSRIYNPEFTRVNMNYDLEIESLATEITKVLL